jgi:uncharacterized membrane protein
MDKIVSGVLRFGVAVSAAVTLAGGVWHSIRSGNAEPNYHMFRGEPVELRSLGGTLHGIAGGHPESLIQFGLLLLVATPVARVLVSVLSFLLEGDRLYAGIASIVLLILLASLTGII